LAVFIGKGNPLLVEMRGIARMVLLVVLLKDKSIKHPCVGQFYFKGKNLI
jgi:hypothetical protein